MRTQIILTLCMLGGCLGPEVGDESGESETGETSESGDTTESASASEGASASESASESGSASASASAGESGDPTSAGEDTGGVEEGGSVEEGGGVDTGDPTSDPTGDPTGNDGAHCHVAWECTDEPDSFACDTPAACDTLTVNDPSLNEFDEEPFAFTNPAAATCMLEALRDGLPATHRIEVEPGQENNLTWELESLGDGTVIVRSEAWFDKCYDATETWAVQEDAEYFTACLASPGEEAMYACLTSPATEACVQGELACP